MRAAAWRRKSGGFDHHARRHEHRQRDDALRGLPALHGLRGGIQRIDRDAVAAGLDA